MENNVLTRHFANLKGSQIKLMINKHDDKVLVVHLQHIKLPKLLITILMGIMAALNTLFLFLGTNYAMFSPLISMGVLYCSYKLEFSISEERLLVIKSLGYQIDRLNHFGKSVTKFIPWADVEDVLINEVITMQRVIFTLSFIHNSKDEPNEVIQVFQSLQPRLECIELIYEHLQKIK